jgi:uncharacterized protein
MDDGLVLFILKKDHKIDIEVGYGLEDKVPDARAKQIIDDTMAPLLRAGKNDEAVTAAVDRILESIEGKVVPAPASGTQAPASRGPVAHGPSWNRIIFYGVIALLLLGFGATHPRLAMLFLLNIASGGRGGGFGGGFGGGGWSGGGGSSGGGGARGSW